MFWVLDSQSWRQACRRAAHSCHWTEQGMSPEHSRFCSTAQSPQGPETQLSPHTKQALHRNSSVPHIIIYRVAIATALGKFISVCEGLRCHRKGFRKLATLHLGWSLLQSRHSVTLNCEERSMHWVTAHSTNILHIVHTARRNGGKKHHFISTAW